jgi:hypothetical protein
MKMPTQPIRLNGPWTALSVVGSRKQAQNPRLKLPERLHWAALARLNLYGHAPFRPDELSEWMGNPTSRGLRRALAVVKDRGQLAPESTARWSACPGASNP